MDEFDLIPVGRVLALGLNLPENDNFLPCNGASKKQEDYPELFAVIGTLYGSSGEGMFNVPDYRGYFLRGADHQANVDPNARERRRPLAATRIGTADTTGVGTYQDYGTAIPTRAEQHFIGPVPHLILDSLQTHGVTQSNRCQVVHEQLTISTCVNGGGDGDTRPVNVYVEFYIKSQS